MIIFRHMFRLFPHIKWSLFLWTLSLFKRVNTCIHYAISYTRIGVIWICIYLMSLWGRHFSVVYLCDYCECVRTPDIKTYRHLSRSRCKSVKHPPNEPPWNYNEGETCREKCEKARKGCNINIRMNEAIYCWFPVLLLIQMYLSLPQLTRTKTIFILGEFGRFIQAYNERTVV